MKIVAGSATPGKMIVRPYIVGRRGAEAAAGGGIAAGSN